MNYNYIYFNSFSKVEDLDNYYNICTRDLERCENVHLVNYPLQFANKAVRDIFAFHNSVRVNRICKLPFKRLWYPFYFKNPFKNDKPLCFIYTNFKMPLSLDYMEYLKGKYPNARFVRTYRDLVSNNRKWYPHMTEEAMNRLLDLQFTFDEGDSKEYGYPWFCEFESKLEDLKPSKNFGKYDVFFAGLVKDRLPKLMAAYDKLTAAGLKVHYFLVGVPQKQRLQKEGVEYSDKPITYREMLQRTIDAKCLLDVNQSNCVGYTSRFLEAVIYNRFLITDNFAVQRHPIFNPSYIHCYKTADDINPEFIKGDLSSVDYHYNGEFSPVRMIETIDRELTKRFL